MQDATAAGQVLGLTPRRRGRASGPPGSSLRRPRRARRGRGGRDAARSPGADAPSSPARAGEAAGAVDLPGAHGPGPGGERGLALGSGAGPAPGVRPAAGADGRPAVAVGAVAERGAGERGHAAGRGVRPGPKGPEPRSVVLGLNDWDRSEVVSGLEAGEEVILISVARLRQQQEELLARIRERSSGPIPGATGGGPGGRAG
jgi:HlyD family secretion protein